MRRVLLVAGVALAVLAGPGAAASADLSDVGGRYAISDETSAIAFTVARVGGGGLAGRFTRFEGDIEIDARQVDRSRVTITIVPDSVTADLPRIEAFLKSDAVFDAANEDAIRFASTAVRRTGPRSAVIHGRLTARGHTRTVTFEAELDDAGEDWVGFRVRGSVLRSLYGIDVGTPIYANAVKLDMHLRATRR